MEGFVLARVLHVLGVVLWIGGVALVTLVLLPAARSRGDAAEGMAWFEVIEARFARQARWATLITGLTGFYMLSVLDAWGRYLDPRFWWVHAMTAIWALFTVALFVLEPLWLHRALRRWSERNPAGALRFLQGAHAVLLLLSLLTVAGAVAGSHGLRIG